MGLQALGCLCQKHWEGQGTGSGGVISLISPCNENKTGALLGGAESKACRGDEEQTVQTLIDAVILSALLPGVPCAEQLLAESFLLSCLLSRPTDLPPSLSHFLPVLLNHSCWPDVSDPPLSNSHTLSPHLISPSGQRTST